MAEPKNFFVNTDYNGATVTNDVAEKLKKQPAAELLRFTEKDGKTVVQCKLPEKGMYNGEEYKIRANMNFLMRGVARFVVTEDGGIDPQRVNELDKMISEFGSIEKLNDEQLNTMMDTFSIPSLSRDDFKRFLAANGVALNQKVDSFLFSGDGPLATVVKETFSQLTAYQLGVSGKQGAEAKEYAQSYQVEYEQMLRQYQDMENLDPFEEKRVLMPMNSFAYASMNNSFIAQNNVWREANGQKPIVFQNQTVKFEKQQAVVDRNGKPLPQDKYNAFEEHNYITLPVKLGEQDGVLSLEATGAPEGDLFHRRGSERTGVGIFPTAMAAEQYHRDNNVRQANELKGVPGAKERELDAKLKREAAKLKGKPEALDITMPKRSYHGYLLAHTGARTVDMPRKELVEAASKAVMASYFMNDPKAPAFSVSAMRKAAANLRSSPQFEAVLMHAGVEKVRSALARGDVAELVSRMYVDPDTRYKLTSESKNALRELGVSMNTKGRSAEWTQLKRALTDPNMKNSMDVVAAVEQYTKGKMAVRRTTEGRNSFDLAMKALAIAARDGDEVAKKRAQILVERINATRKAGCNSPNYINLETLAPAPQAAPAAAFDAEAYIKSLDPGVNNPVVDLWVKTVTDVYKPVPVFNEKTEKFGGYTKEDFKQLKQYDLSKLPVGSEPVGDVAFAALTSFAMYRAEPGGAYISNVANAGNGYCRIPANLKPSLGIARNIAFTGAFTDMGSKGGYGDRKFGTLFKDVSQPSREIVYDALQQYRQGNKQALGKLIGQGVKAMMECKFSATKPTLMMGDETMTLFRFVNATVQLAQRDPELRSIAEKNGMTKDVLNSISGVQRYDTLSRIANAATEKLKSGDNLTPEEKKACVTAILRFRAVGERQKEEYYKKSEAVLGDNPLKKALQLEAQAAEEEDPEKKKALMIKTEYYRYRDNGLQSQKSDGAPPSIQALGREGDGTVDRLLGKAKIDVDRLIDEYKDTKQLLKTLESKELYIPKPNGPDRLAGIRVGARPQPAPAPAQQRGNVSQPKPNIPQ